MSDLPKEFIKQEEDLLQSSEAIILPSDKYILANLLYKAKKEKKQLRVKLGIDPTSSELHFGHTVCLHLLRKFQELGHLPVLIIGGFTATVGDPSGRDTTRPPLTFKEVEENSKTYLDQVKKILDLNKVEIVNNYKWLSKLDLAELLKLAHLVTVNQLIAKEAFGTRVASGKPLYLHEVLYPLLQGYDSVAISADIEIGGVDQTFNVLFGRHVQKHFNQKEQIALFVPLLIGLDGKKKMSKTFNNHIALNDPPNEIFGKAMSISDDLIIHYLKLVSNFSLDEIMLFEQHLKEGKNPRDIKAKLAYNLVLQIYNESAANGALENFDKQFKLHEMPDSMPEFVLGKPLKIIDLMLESKLTESKSEAKRLIEGGGVKLKSIKVSDPYLVVTKEDKNSVLQIGKRKFIRIV